MSKEQTTGSKALFIRLMVDDPSFCLESQVKKAERLGVTDRTIRNYLKDKKATAEIAEMLEKRWTHLKNPIVMKLAEQWLKEGDYEAYDRLAVVVGLRDKPTASVDVNLGGSATIGPAAPDEELLSEMGALAKQFGAIVKANGGNGHGHEEEKEDSEDET